MCGISGCVGSKSGVGEVLECLKILEYRGYDSSGVAFFKCGKVKVVRAVGELSNLQKKVKIETPLTAVIGHTRWATHGKPTLLNAHPHIDEAGQLALVHNGIIENYEALRGAMINSGVMFSSETDTEVIAQALGRELKGCKRLDSDCVLRAIRAVFSKIRGTYAVAFVVAGLDNRIFFAKKSSPLIIGTRARVGFVASDINALIGKCEQIYLVKDNEYGFVSADEVWVQNFLGGVAKAEFVTLNATLDSVKLNHYSSYLQKEIEEGAGVTIKTIKNCVAEIDKILPCDLLAKTSDIHIVACGTALNAGRVLGYLIERELRLKVSIDFASEFKYKRPIVKKGSLCIFISQSGETADTLGCVELAKRLGAVTIGVTNVRTSRIAHMVDFCLYTYAGAEISVASTKAYLAQLGLGYVLVEFLAKNLHKKVCFDTQKVINTLARSKNKRYLQKLAPYLKLISGQKSIFFVGRGLDYFVAMEGALKLKEVCYIHCEAISAGELKHGSLALIDKNSVVVAVLTQEALVDKMLSNIHEINSRGAKVILFSPFERLKNEVFGFVKLPKCLSALSPLIAIKPLQELTLFVAQRKGIDPDKPRNLAKSVTVE